VNNSSGVSSISSSSSSQEVPSTPPEDLQALFLERLDLVRSSPCSSGGEEDADQESQLKGTNNNKAKAITDATFPCSFPSCRWAFPSHPPLRMSHIINFHLFDERLTEVDDLQPSIEKLLLTPSEELDLIQELIQEEFSDLTI